MRIRMAALVALMVSAPLVGQSPSSFDVRAFGARGDDKRLARVDKDAL